MTAKMQMAKKTTESENLQETKTLIDWRAFLQPMHVDQQQLKRSDKPASLIIHNCPRLTYSHGAVPSFYESRRADMADTPSSHPLEGIEIPMTERLITADPIEDSDRNTRSHPHLDTSTFAIILTTNSFDSADKSLLTPAFRALVFSFDSFEKMRNDERG
jgi:hypothetical protein